VLPARPWEPHFLLYEDVLRFLACDPRFRQREILGPIDEEAEGVRNEGSGGFRIGKLFGAQLLPGCPVIPSQYVLGGKMRQQSGCELAGFHGWLLCRHPEDIVQSTAGGEAADALNNGMTAV
jgi:hypothetical protein